MSSNSLRNNRGGLELPIIFAFALAMVVGTGVVTQMNSMNNQVNDSVRRGQKDSLLYKTQALLTTFSGCQANFKDLDYVLNGVTPIEGIYKTVGTARGGKLFESGSTPEGFNDNLKVKTVRLRHDLTTKVDGTEEQHIAKLEIEFESNILNRSSVNQYSFLPVLIKTTTVGGVRKINTCVSSPQVLKAYCTFSKTIPDFARTACAKSTAQLTAQFCPEGQVINGWKLTCNPTAPNQKDKKIIDYACSDVAGVIAGTTPYQQIPADEINACNKKIAEAVPPGGYTVVALSTGTLPGGGTVVGPDGKIISPAPTGVGIIPGFDGIIPPRESPRTISCGTGLIPGWDTNINDYGCITDPNYTVAARCPAGQDWSVAMNRCIPNDTGTGGGLVETGPCAGKTGLDLTQCTCITNGGTPTGIGCDMSVVDANKAAAAAAAELAAKIAACESIVGNTWDSTINKCNYSIAIEPLPPREIRRPVIIDVPGMPQLM